MDNARELIRNATVAMGKGNSDTDWKLAPSEHAELLAKASAPLAEILQGARLSGLAKMYENLNQTAVQARDTFKNNVTRANQAVFCTATFGALLLIAGGLQGPLGKTGSGVVIGIGILGIIAGGLAAMWLALVRGGSFAGRWAQERAKAEAKRLAYFKAFMDEAPAEPLQQLLAFEYTRRFLLDNQIDYFRDRGGQHEKAAGIALKKSTYAMFAASTATIGAGALSMLSPQLAVIAGLGVIASAYAALVVSQSSVNQDRRNADRYRLAGDQIEERKLEMDIYRLRIAAGEKGVLQEFFEPIFVALAADHKEFLNNAEQREIAISDIEGRLKAAREALSQESAGKPGQN